jgi:hypothetical protein
MDNMIREWCTPLNNHHWCNRRKTLLLIYELPDYYTGSLVEEKLIYSLLSYKKIKPHKKTKVESYVISEKRLGEKRLFYCLIQLRKSLGSMGIKDFDFANQKGDYYVVNDLPRVLEYVYDKNSLLSGFKNIITIQSRSYSLSSIILAIVLLISFLILSTL